MLRPGGYAVITSPDGIREADTFTCRHCDRITHVRAGAPPEDLGGFCSVCAGLICKHCVGGACSPLEARLEAAERRYDTLRSYGLA